MSKILPVNEFEFFEIRFHSIGGQGAYTTGQMLATTIAGIDSINAAVFASYGSEKKGAPVNVFIRVAEDQKITNYSAVNTPNMVVVFHERLLTDPNVMTGIKDDAIFVVNTDLSAQEVVDMYGLNLNNIVTVSGTDIAVEQSAKINTVMYGACVKALSFINPDLARDQIAAKLSYKYPHLVEANISAFNSGYENATFSSVTPGTAKTQTANAATLGYNTQVEGGVILGANAQKVDRSISREGYLPHFDKETCINCTKCDMTCPDDCFVWEEVEGRRGRMEMTLQGIDYQFCKGCLRCVTACPTGSLTSHVEERGYAEANSIKKIYQMLEQE
ncbi:2-oxoacid:acceptor oxidoreductase family protein [Mollicutes bacterium LVI A0039]|nr:2-oxoacid:acceptor oxidoreductase family protein [Mollicutes bacterium LVI A0039]